MWKWDEMSEAERWCYMAPVLVVGGVAVQAALVAAAAIPVLVGYWVAEEAKYQQLVMLAVFIAEICVPALIAGVCLTIRRRWTK